jgi:hypothetical protein
MINPMAAKSSKKLSNEIVEPELCVVCRERFTSILRKKALCKFCQASACSKCIEQYLLTRHEDAHCLHCRVNYTDATLFEICTKTYLQQTYFKHRQEVLINRHRAQLPLLQEAAMREKRDRERNAILSGLQKEINDLRKQRDEILILYNRAYVAYFGQNALRTDEGMRLIEDLMAQAEDLREQMREKRTLMHQVRWPGNFHQTHQVEEKEEEKKKFVRRCTRDGCKGFLSTAWKCGICEWYSCSKCFAVKGQTHDVEHECKKEDIETAELIKKECKPCPKCGEFIEKSSGCDQMFCISCQTPFSWITGKIVTSGPIHNPHYYEWLKRTGGNVQRNPADVPCGGFPGGWELVRFPRGINKDIANMFFEFHRICMELQDISTRSYRSHIDQDTMNQVNIKFLLDDIDEKKWGQLLATNEKKRKRDSEIQEVLGAFRMVAVELINRVQQFTDGPIVRFTDLPIPRAEAFIIELNNEIMALVNMINDALRGISISYSYSVPYITLTPAQGDRFTYYAVRIKNFSAEVKKKREKKSVKEETDDEKEEALKESV